MSSESKNPFHGFVDTLAEMARMREYALRGTEDRTEANAWVPTVDILIDGDDIIVRCELPGVAGEDVDVSLSHNTLWIWGQRNHPTGEEGRVSFYVHERSMGAFRRSISLPPHIDATNLAATFEDGLLEIRIADAVSDADVERIEIATPTAGGSEDITVRKDGPR